MNMNNHALAGVTDLEKDGFIELNEETVRAEEIVAHAEKVVERAELDAEIAESDVTLVIGGVKLVMNSVVDAGATLADILAAVTVKAEEDKLRRYLRNKYLGKLTLDAFAFETGMSTRRCINCYQSLNMNPPDVGAKYWFTVTDTIMILMMLRGADEA